VSVAPKERSKRDVLLDALLELVRTIETHDDQRYRVVVGRAQLKWLIEVIEGDDEQECSERAWLEAGAA
jgi:hypothetical protein